MLWGKGEESEKLTVTGNWTQGAYLLVDLVDYYGENSTHNIRFSIVSLDEFSYASSGFLHTGNNRKLEPKMAWIQG